MTVKTINWVTIASVKTLGWLATASVKTINGDSVSNWMANWLVAYYKFDESSGNATDSKWGFTLTNNGTCTYGAGMLNNSVTTTTVGTKYMSTTSDLGLNGSSQNFTFAWWIRPTATIATQQVFFDHTDAGQHNNIALDWFWWNARLIRTRLWVASDIVSVAQTFSIATVYCIVCKYDWSTLSLRINNWTATTVSSTGNWSSGGTDWFAVGAYIWGGTWYLWESDEFAIWNRSITSAEETLFYNGGSPLPYASYT